MPDFSESGAPPPASLSNGDICVVLHPELKSQRAGPRDADARLAEAVGLAEAIDLSVAHASVVPVERIRPGTFFGSGSVERLKDVISDLSHDPDDPEAAPKTVVVVVDGAVSPVQQRNLERAWKCKVIDRTGLILEIFGARARTREGRLQVELAALTYQRSRLVRSWTHLERQRGGFGFLGGPGETQIESDRRQIGDRIARLKRELGEVARTRGLHRAARQRVPYPVVALVGYTNAGKSTLFNRLTRASVDAKDLLFATLDPTMRGLDLPRGFRIILSDTVGFISDLPHELVAAFRATLEEVTEADVVVHVRDAAHPDTEAQKADVLGVLRDMGLGDRVDNGLIEVLNKADLLPPDRRDGMIQRTMRSDAPLVVLSALTGEGCDRLLTMLETRVTATWGVFDVTLSPGEGALISWLYDHGHVAQRTDDAEGIHLKVHLDDANRARFDRMRRH